MTAWDLGRVSEAASAADDAIFHVLATARANCHVKMTDAQLFGPDPARRNPQDERDAYEADGGAEEPAVAEEPEKGEAADAPGEAPADDAHSELRAVDGDADGAGSAARPVQQKPRRPIHAV